MIDSPSDDELKEEFDEIILEFLRKHDAGQSIAKNSCFSIPSIAIDCSSCSKQPIGSSRWQVQPWPT